MKKSANRLYPTRVERNAHRRRERARDHLAAVRTRGSGARLLPTWLGRLLAIAVAVISIAAGAALGTPNASRFADWLAPSELSRIHVRGALRLDPAAVSLASGAIFGELVSRQDLPRIIENVQGHLWVASARATLLPGGILIVEIEEHVPEAVVVVPADSTGSTNSTNSATTRVLLVNRHGLPFAPASPEDVEVLPHLLPTGSVVLGEPDARLAAALELVQRLPEHGLPGSIEIFIAAADDPVGLVMQLPELPARIVLGWVDPGARLEQLTALLSSDLAEVRSASTIDLRFAGQAVLRTSLSKEGEQAAATRGFALPSIELSTG